MAIVLRTIRKGRVKVGNRWFVPDPTHTPYDGRLDGLRYGFGTYPSGIKGNYFLSLWGTEELFNAQTDAEIESIPNGPDVFPDGTMPWVWWREQVAEKNDSGLRDYP